MLALPPPPPPLHRKLIDEDSVVVVYDNPLDNVPDLAHHFFSRCLVADDGHGVTPYVVTKKTVFKWQVTTPLHGLQLQSLWIIPTVAVRAPARAAPTATNMLSPLCAHRRPELVFFWQEGFWLAMKAVRLQPTAGRWPFLELCRRRPLIHQPTNIAQVFDEHYREQYRAKGLLENTGGELQHFISDAATMQVGAHFWLKCDPDKRCAFANAAACAAAGTAADAAAAAADVTLLKLLRLPSQIIRWTGGGFGMAAHNCP